MARTRAEMDRIRTANRAHLGLAGLGISPFGGAFGDLGGAVTGAVRRATIRTSFPATETVWEPGREEPSAEEGSRWGSWMLAHAVRPEAEIETPFGTIRVAPYERDADWSGFFRATAVGAGVGVGLGVGWILFRAFFGGGR